MRNKIILIFIIIVLFVAMGIVATLKFNKLVPQGLAQLNPDTSDWRVYHNERYGYQIKYPKNLYYHTGETVELDLWLTGSPTERDGLQFRIALKNRPLPSTLDIELHPGLSIDQIKNWEDAKLPPEVVEHFRKIKKEHMKEHTTSTFEIVVNEKEGVKTEHRFPTGELSAFFIIINGVAFKYTKVNDAFDEKIAEEIISTFRFLKN